MSSKEEQTNALDPRSNRQDGERLRVLNRELFLKGKTIINQGDQAFRAYYIEEGHVEISIMEDGVELKVTELGPGDIFGEMALIEEGPRTATVRALDDVSTTVISRDEIKGKIDSIHDKAIRALIDLLVTRLREATEGQIHHYKNLAQFQDRVTGIVDRVDLGIDESKRDGFRDEVTPLLDDLQKVLDRYQKGG
ncbi:MAG: hypothetical protein DHS20C02_20160 [Micavibrio sp.]|nr:MAG: hypothetical protein DHS20C02_20160 [Micavibrio sp.]